MVSIPRAICATCSGTCRILRAPSITPGKPVPNISRQNFQLKWLSRRCLAVAPTPRATLATLWVARAVPKDKPKKMSTGNCISPAPPPARALKKLAMMATKNSSIYSKTASWRLSPWDYGLVSSYKKEFIKAYKNE